MSKSISLEEFKNRLESDATRKLDNLEKRTMAQEKTIKETTELLKEKIATIAEQKEIIDQLSNRCYALTSFGSLCVYCGIKKECKNSPANRFIKRMMGGK